MPEEKCNCSGGSPANATLQSEADSTTKVVQASITQEYQANFNLRIVPGRSLAGIDNVLRMGCQPRGNTRPGWGDSTVEINPELAATLATADKAMMAWLSKDAVNAQRFVQDPVASMREAGVEMTRAQEKVLVRAASAAQSLRQAAPGVNIASLTATVFPNGKVGSVGSTKPDQFNCGPKRKKG